eukprot:5330032-Pleurochrysis_carterae.AAC.3
MAKWALADKTDFGCRCQGILRRQGILRCSCLDSARRRRSFEELTTPAWLPRMHYPQWPANALPAVACLYCFPDQSLRMITV